jgi:hypothetical protein
MWKPVAVCLAAIVAILACETFWLRPLLDARVLAIMGGQSAPRNTLHEFYIGLEAAKLALIITAGVFAGRNPATMVS